MLRSVEPKPKKAKATRLAEDWALPDDWRNWTRVNCVIATDDGIKREALKFANYWQSKATNATKRDWYKTWQNWCLNNFATGPTRPSQQVPRPLTDREIRTQQFKEALARKREEATHVAAN